ncbi:MAG: hypothetical protein K0V04_39030 [Deltaproteobacteria bacterium]|nr:hypothetical protein [Deltaproteobacteria bacterium]
MESYPPLRGYAAEEAHSWQAIDDVIISFTIPGTIPQDRWNAFVRDIIDIRPRHCLVLCIGDVQVDALMRRRSTDAVLRSRSSVTVVTNSRMTRGLATAVSWFGAKLDAYAWTEVDRAVDGLGVSKGTAARLLDQAKAFQRTCKHLDR